MVGVEGFEPSEWMSQSHLPYRLATPQFKYLRAVSLFSTNNSLGHLVGIAGFEPANDGVKVRCLTAWLYPIVRK